MTKRSILSAAILTVVVPLLMPQQAVAGQVVVSGTGMALAAMRIAGEAFTAANPDTTINVLPSMGSGGGIKALQDEVLDLSLSARRLKPAEKQAGLVEAYCFRTALVFASQPGHQADFALADLPGLYSDVSPVWPNGAPLKVIMRAQSGSEHPYLAKNVPGLDDAFKVARTRPGTVVGMTDQLNADIAEKMEGGFAITSLLQINGEKRRLEAVSIDGVKPGPSTVEDGSYPFSMKVCIIAKPARLTAEARRFLNYLQGDEGKKVIVSLGALTEQK